MLRSFEKNIFYGQIDDRITLHQTHSRHPYYQFHKRWKISLIPQLRTEEATILLTYNKPTSYYCDIIEAANTFRGMRYSGHDNHHCGSQLRNTNNCAVTGK